VVGFRPEVEWDEEQQAIMLALGRYRELCCPGCGGWIPETTGKDAKDTYAVDLVRCHRCSAHAMAAEKARSSSLPESLLMQVTKKPPRRR
jgi:hypothetical protein